MKAIALPGADFTVSELCLGSNSFGGSLTTEREDQLFGAFREAGGNFCDTAHCYSFWTGDGAGSNERALGAAIRRANCRNQIILATKGGHPGDKGYPRPDLYLSADIVRSDIRDSLRNLGVETIDLYYLHRDDPRVPVAEILGYLNEEITAGNLRAIGVSNWSVERIAEANAYAAAHRLKSFSASQVQWSLPVPNWTPSADPTTRFVTGRDAEAYEVLGLPIVAYSATASGYLAGNERANNLYDNDVSRERRERARIVANELRVTPNQIGLAYLRHQEPTTIPLFGTTNPSHLHEAIEAMNLVLTPQQVQYLAYG
jgi:aryl-alcohol dehydrogenase-like predicted oxidoreductase